MSVVKVQVSCLPKLPYLLLCKTTSESGTVHLTQSSATQSQTNSLVNYSIGMPTCMMRQVVEVLSAGSRPSMFSICMLTCYSQ